MESIITISIPEGNESLNQLYADMVHKMKNSLGGITGFTALLYRELDERDPNRKLSRRIQDSAEKLNMEMVDLMSVLNVYSPEFEQISLIHSLKRSILSYFKENELPENFIQIDSNLKNDLNIIRSDSELLEKLLFHALRFCDIISEQIQYLSIKELDQNRKNIAIIIQIQNTSILKILSENIFHWEQINSLDARVSMAILLKIIKLFNYELHWEQHNEDTFELSLDLT